MYKRQVPAPDEAAKFTETEQPGSGTTVHRASIGEEKSLSELELGKAKSLLNNVLSDASLRKEASTTGEEVYGADECPVEKRPSRNVRMPKKYADYHLETVPKQRIFTKHADRVPQETLRISNSFEKKLSGSQLLHLFHVTENQMSSVQSDYRTLLRRQVQLFACTARAA